MTLVKVATTAVGSAIGDMTGSGGLLAAFNGTTSEAAAGCASLVAALSNVGKAWDSPKSIGQAAVWDPNNEGFNAGGGAVEVKIFGNTTNNFGTAVLLASVAATAYAIPLVVVTVAQSDFISTTGYAYTWAAVSSNVVSTNRIGEVEFWELV